MRRAVVILCLLVLPGCSLLVPKFETPTLTILGVQLLKSDLWHQELKVRLRVQNPNDRDLPVNGLSYIIELDGQQFAHGESSAAFVVPARGEAEFEMPVSANMASMMIKLLGQGGGPVEYHIAGRIGLSAGLLHGIKFDDRGTFSLQ